MEIYVRVTEDSGYAWYTYDRDEGCEYMTSGKELFADSPYGDYLRGSPCKTFAEAKRAARRARRLSNDDGYGVEKVEFFRFVKGKLVPTKFTRDGKIKR